MGTFIDKLKDALKNFKDEQERSLGKNYEHKHNVQKLRTEMQEGMFKGLFYRDGNRLIISAPEVIIGNVDENGMLIHGKQLPLLKPGHSHLLELTAYRPRPGDYSFELATMLCVLIDRAGSESGSEPAA